MLHFFPTKITAGISLKREVVLDDYPAPVWRLSAILRGPSSIDLDADPAGSAHVFSVPAADTQSWAAGDYAVALRVAAGADVFEVEAGQLTVAADLVSVGAGHEARSHAQRTLAAIEAVIEGRASKDQQSYAINGRSLVRTSIADLLLLRDRYRAEVAAAQSNGRHKRLMGRQVKVRFGR